MATVPAGIIPIIALMHNIFMGMQHKTITAITKLVPGMLELCT